MKQQCDGLTRLPSGAALASVLKQKTASSAILSLAMVDVDLFDRINTDFGEAVGDRVLQTMAALLQEEVPDAIYRISGDEFAVLLYDMSLEQAFLRVEVLRLRVQDANVRFGLPDGRAVTITVGVAQYPRDARTPSNLTQAAWSALQVAKEHGRNRVGLPPNEEMVMKSCYYPATSVRRLKTLAERMNRKESHLLREALDDLFRKYDIPREV